MRFLLPFLLLFLPSFAFAQQGSQPIVLGWTPGIVAVGATNVTLSSSTQRGCQGFVPPDSKTLSTVTFWINSKTGTPTATDIKVTLRADSAGLPSTDIEEEDLSATPTSGVFNTSNAFSSALTAGTRYYICVRNAHGTPASNHVTITYPSSTSEGRVGLAAVHGAEYHYGWAGGTSSDSGTTFSSAAAGVVFMKFTMSDGSVLGINMSNGHSSESGCKIASTTEAGAVLTVPLDGPGINIKCLSTRLERSGTVPSGGLRFRLYTGTSTSPTATSSTISNTSVVYDGYYFSCFSSPVTIAPGTVLRATLGAVSGGDGSNYVMVNRITTENTASSLSQTAFGGLKFACLASGAWTDTSEKVPALGIILDTNDPFDVSAGSLGTGSKLNKGFN